jgi:xylulokinase
MGMVIGVDLGTTHVKSIAFDELGNVLHLEKCATPLVFKETGCCYEPEQIWQTVKGQVETLLRVCLEKCIGISVTGMAEAGLICSRRSKQALTEILPWFDERPVKISHLAEARTETELFAATGLRKSFKYGIYKFLWLRQTLSETLCSVADRDLIWLSICDFVVLCLTGELVTDPTFAARTFVFDLARRTWDIERIRSLGLELWHFPRIVESGEVIGAFHGIPVALAGHDHVLTAFGLLYSDPDKMIDSAGTSETFIGLPRVGKMSYLSGLLYGPFVDEGNFFMANIPASGQSIEWFRKTLQVQEMSYQEMNRGLLARQRRPTGLCYYPYLTGMGSPFFRSDLSGGLLGFSHQTDGFEVLQGMIEGISFQAKWLFAIFKEYHGVLTDEVICAGGSTMNETMMQIKADILNAVVVVPKQAEATLLGAAALFLKKNQGDDPAKAFLTKQVVAHKTYYPTKSYVEQYGEIYLKWKERMDLCYDTKFNPDA